LLLKVVSVNSRFIRTKAMNAFLNLALEESLLFLQNGVTARIWENERSVIIGRGQFAPYETDLPYCKKNGIPIVRRITAGGAVYNGPGNINWSIFMKRDSLGSWERVARNPLVLFAFASGIVVRALGGSGVRSTFEAPNRIMTREGKVSGMAAYITKDRALCHGTLLLNADLIEAQRLTTPVQQQLSCQYTRSANTIIANAGVQIERYVPEFRKALAQELQVEVEEDEVASSELESAEELVGNRYSQDSWNIGDPFGTVDQT
jgi:lipoate-protein ligase A